MDLDSMIEDLERQQNLMPDERAQVAEWRKELGDTGRLSRESLQQLMDLRDYRL